MTDGLILWRGLWIIICWRSGYMFIWVGGEGGSGEHGWMAGIEFRHGTQ